MAAVIAKLLRILDYDVSFSLMMQAFSIFNPVSLGCQQIEKKVNETRNEELSRKPLILRSTLSSSSISQRSGIDFGKQLKRKKYQLIKTSERQTRKSASSDDTNFTYDKLGSSVLLFNPSILAAYSMTATLIFLWLIILKCFFLLIIFNVKELESYKYLNCYIPGRIFFPSSSLNTALIFASCFSALALFWMHAHNNKVLYLDSMVYLLAVLKFSLKRWQGQVELKYDDKHQLIEPDYIPNSDNNSNLNDEEYFHQVFLKYAINSWYHATFYLKLKDNIFKEAKYKLQLKEHRDYFAFKRKRSVLLLFLIIGFGLYVSVILSIALGFETFLLTDDNMINFYPGCFSLIEKRVKIKGISNSTEANRNLSLKDTYRLLFLLPFDMLDNGVYYINLGKLLLVVIFLQFEIY